MIRMNCVTKLTLEEIVHMEKSVAMLRHMVQISHKVACQEFLACHPMMAQLLRDYITSAIDQANSLLSAQGHINQMYRTILQEGCDEQSQNH